MELITGKRLDQLYTSAEPLNEVRALDIAIGVASALRAANEIGLIHGDVKPANIMLDEKEEARLVDFGIARFGGGRVAEDAALGTPYYVAPEQVARGSVDHRADMYSLGATLFHALAGTPPFPGKTMKKVLLARLNRRAPDLLTSRPFLRRKTASVVARMLQTRPDDRHRTYDELLADLEAARLVALGEVPQREPDSRVGVEEQPAPAKRRWPILIGAAAVLVVAAAAAYVLYPWPGVPSTRPSAGVGASSGTDTPEGQTAAPVFSPPGRTIDSPMTVTLECAVGEATVYYTIDGRYPTLGSIRYGGPIRVKPGTTIRARAYRDGWEPSAIVQAGYERASVILSDVTRIRAKADGAWRRAQFLDPGQGFKAKLARCTTLHTNAETFFKLNDYPKAQAAYARLLDESEKLMELNRQRKLAAAAGASVAAAVKPIKSDGGKNDPNGLWRKIGETRREAQAAFDAGDFTKAQDLWSAAAKHTEARYAGLADLAGAAYDKALAEYGESALKSYGGAGWAAAQKAVAEARRARRKRDFGKARAQYVEALKQLAIAREEMLMNKCLADVRALIGAVRYRAALARINGEIKRGRSPAWLTSLETMKKAIESKILLAKKVQAGGASMTMRLVLIPAGEFLMGSPPGDRLRSLGEVPYKVVISKPFYIGATEVTLAQYRCFVRARGGSGKFRTEAEKTGSADGWNGKKWGKIKGLSWRNPVPGAKPDDRHPAVCLTWQEAVVFCEWMSKAVGRTVRLPTEAEWEYACRAGTTTPFSFGDKIQDLAQYGNYRDKSAKISRVDAGSDGHPMLAPVRKYKRNPWRLYDMHGNAMEWCADWMGAYPRSRLVVTDPKGPRTGRFRMVRGGAWYTPARQTRSAARLGIGPDYYANTIGFRVVVEATTGPAAGKIGLGTWKTQAEFKDVRVTRGKEQLFAADFAGNAAPGWQVLGGKWEVRNGAYRQLDGGGSGLFSVAGDTKWSDYTFTVKARKISGDEGFQIRFLDDGAGNAYFWNIGGWRNKMHAIERISGKAQKIVSPQVRGSVDTGKWYDVKIELQGRHVRCLLNGKVFHDVDLLLPVN